MRRTLVAGVIAAALVSAAGCGADEPRPRIAEPTGTPTATGAPSDSPSDDPEVETGPPKLSDEAQQPTLDGAVAFTKYFWDVVNYSQRTGDLRDLSGIVSSSCAACQGAISTIRRSTRDGNEIRGGRLRVIDPVAEDASTGDTTAFTVAFSTRNTAQKILRDGEVVERYRPDTIDSTFLVVKTSEAWRVDLWKVDS